MKKLVSILLLLAFVASVFAAPAHRITIKHKQSDGSELFLVLNGDEAYHYLSTLDGVPVVKGDGGDYYYAILDDENNLQPSVLIAHNEGSRNFDELSIIATNNFSGMQQSMSNAARARAAKYAVSRAATVTTTGNVNVPVLLVEYQDVKFSFSKEEVSDILNKENYEGYDNPIAKSVGSAKDYFIAQSDGKFVPNFIVTDIVTLPNNMAYYGQNTSSGYDCRPGHMIADGLAGADANIDFSIFDNDGDGKVEFVYCIYAGYGENVSGNDENTIWPQQWELSSTVGKKTHDGVVFDVFACSNELSVSEAFSEAYGGKFLSGIGTMCHEFSHCLGLPDFYDTSSGSTGLSTFGYWDLMDSGSYAAEGYVPVGYSAYERDFMGWRTMETLTDAGCYSMQPLTNGGTGYKIINDANSNEYYILEARKQEGWDKYLFANGMLITHVDYSKAAWDSNDVNVSKDHLRFSLVAADNEILEYDGTNGSAVSASYKGDVWPGTSGNTAFTDTSVPASEVFTGEALGKPVTNIRYKNGVVYFSFMYDFIFEATNGKEILVEYTGSDSEIIMPDYFCEDNYIIGENLFKNDATITSVTIGEGVTSIAAGAFSGCTALETITSKTQTPATVDATTFSDYSATLYVPVGTASTYKATDYWKNFYIVESGFTGIEEVKGDKENVDNVWYDLGGRRVENPGKGIYIVNGKKVLVK